MRLIGLCGKAGSGKDTVADYLVAEHGFEKYAFADPIRAAVKAAFTLDDEHFTNRELKETVVPWIGKSPRQLAQLFGTEFGRQLVADDIWVRCAAARWGGMVLEALEAFHPIAGLVVSDVRFENEAAWIRSSRGVVIHVQRETAKQVSAHVSEAGIVPVAGDYVIMNDGAYDGLYRAIDTVLQLR